MKTLKIVFRNLLKNKLVSGINLIGLTLGIVVSMLLLTYAQAEKNTDTFIQDYDDIYYLRSNKGSTLSKPMIDFIRDKIPNIELTYFSNNWAGQVYLSDESMNRFKVKQLLDTDSTFFNVFKLEPLYGNLQNALTAPNTIVLTESLARKIFGNKNPVGKTLNYNTSYLPNEVVEVTAVLKDLPQNTAWQFDAILSIQTNNKIGWYRRNTDLWYANNYAVFFKTKSQENFQSLENQLESLVQTSEIRSNISRDFAFKITPYSQNYFSSTMPANLKHGNQKTLTILQLIAILVIFMASVNYVNLILAQKEKRNKGVAIVKMLGSSKGSIIKMFALETLIIISIVLVLYVYLVSFAIKILNNVVGTNYQYDFMFSSSSLFFLILILSVIFIVTGIFLGIVFSRQDALKLIKPKKNIKKHIHFANILPIVQFTISIALITCLIGIKKQNDMMLNQDTGFSKEQIIVASTNDNIDKGIQTLENEIKNISGIADITFADGKFGSIGRSWTIDYINNGQKQPMEFCQMSVSQNFFDFFGIKLLEGNAFNENKNNLEEFIFNKTAIEQYGISDINSVKLKVKDNTQLIGVVENFNFESAHDAIRPIGFTYGGKVSEKMYVKLNAKNFAQTQQALAQIEQIWNKISPNLPLEYQFLDDSWNNLYKKEVQFQNILNYASLISIIIATLGLFGLSMFVVERRTKEIGMRKINGANIKEILVLLNSSFVKWVVVAFVIATPIAYYAMNLWLENFAYKTKLSWWIFALAGMFALFIALLTVSWQSWRAASKNPVEALRYE